MGIFLAGGGRAPRPGHLVPLVSGPQPPDPISVAATPYLATLVWVEPIKGSPPPSSSYFFPPFRSYTIVLHTICVYQILLHCSS